MEGGGCAHAGPPPQQWRRRCCCPRLEVNTKGVVYIVEEPNRDTLSGTGGHNAAYVERGSANCPDSLLADAAGDHGVMQRGVATSLIAPPRRHCMREVGRPVRLASHAATSTTSGVTGWKFHP